MKHDARMAAVLRRALYAGISEPTESVVVPDGSYRLRVPGTALARHLGPAGPGVGDPTPTAVMGVGTFAPLRYGS